MKSIITIIIIMTLAGFGWAVSKNNTQINIKLSQLCSAHRDMSCEYIINNCRESLEKGFDCLIIK